MAGAEAESSVLPMSAPLPALEERFDRLVLLVREIFGTEIAAVNAIEGSRLVTISMSCDPSVGLHPIPTFCRYTIQQDGILEVTDLREDSRFSSDALVTGPSHLRFYAGVPLLARTGQRVASMCLIDTEPRTLSGRDRAILRHLGDVAERELAVGADLVRAARVQRSLLPRTAPTLAGLDVAGCVRPARDVGGDFFDWQVISSQVNTVDERDRVQVTVADVMGKGLPASLLAAGLRGVLRAHSTYVDLGRAVHRTQVATQSDLEDNTTFVTLWSTRIDPDTGMLEYLDAGHGLAAIISPEGLTRRLVQDRPPLGIAWSDDWVTAVDRLAPGEFLLVVSDGILDVFPDHGTAHARAEMLAGSTRSSQELADQIADFATSRESGDDVTALVVRRVAS